MKKLLLLNLLAFGLINGEPFSEQEYRELIDPLCTAFSPDKKADAKKREARMISDGIGDDYGKLALEMSAIGMSDTNVLARRESLRVVISLLDKKIYKSLGTMGETYVRFGQDDEDEEVKNLANYLDQMNS